MPSRSLTREARRCGTWLAAYGPGWCDVGNGGTAFAYRPYFLSVARRRRLVAMSEDAKPIRVLVRGRAGGARRRFGIWRTDARPSCAQPESAGGAKAFPPPAASDPIVVNI